MKTRNTLLAILFVLCSALFAGCGGGGDVAGDPNTGVVTNWQINLFKKVEQVPGGPSAIGLPSIMDGGIIKYLASSTDGIIAYVDADGPVEARGGPSVSYTITNTVTGLKLHYSSEATSIWTLKAGDYRIDGVVDEKYQAAPAFLLVRQAVR